MKHRVDMEENNTLYRQVYRLLKAMLLPPTRLPSELMLARRSYVRDVTSLSQQPCVLDLADDCPLHRCRKVTHRKRT